MATIYLDFAIYFVLMSLVVRKEPVILVWQEAETMPLPKGVWCARCANM